MRARPARGASGRVREHANSGNSGVVPKFLDEAEEAQQSSSPFSDIKKANLVTRRHVVKGSSKHGGLLFAAWPKTCCQVQHVLGAHRKSRARSRATTLLLSYALRNADCHAKNLHKFITANFGIQPKEQTQRVVTKLRSTKDQSDLLARARRHLDPPSFIHRQAAH